MSHVSALPNSPPSRLDESAAEAAQYALQAFSGGVKDVDAMDAAVGVVGVVAVARLAYYAVQHPSVLQLLSKVTHVWAPIRSLLFLKRTPRPKSL